MTGTTTATTCDECVYDYAALDQAALAAAVREGGDAIAGRTAGAPLDTLRAHPRPGWSALAYACHVRDVLAVQRGRVALAQTADRPEFTPMGRDELAVRDRYDEQDPATVAARLRANAAALAADLDTLPDPGWQRSGFYSYPTRQLRTVDWVVRHTVHELVHHRFDIDRLLAGVQDAERKA